MLYGEMHLYFSLGRGSQIFKLLLFLLHKINLHILTLFLCYKKVT